VRSLSGGERNRLLLARLFARPANVLVLDEPTNDLDIDTLELLEDLLQNYDGTVFLVSHDRTFLDNVVTSTIAYEGAGNWREFEGGVTDWQTQSKRASSRGVSAVSTVDAAVLSAQVTRSTKPKKLSYKETRELEQLPDLVAGLEAEQNSLSLALADGTLFFREPAKAAEISARIAAIEASLTHALERWEMLAA
jgi:ATP-binding cassette subfamily F protein uup